MTIAVEIEHSATPKQPTPTWVIQEIQLISADPDIYRIAFRNRETGELVDSDISF
ncbi:MAG TPA: hypothetical protein VGS22_16410 [Thermoanaerobaculia bacterium]|nr:hypothetical protein [Thermoanaerobaculia bacterium]